ncbi:MAG: DUF4299 family protein [Coprobacillaceae bacterium]
MSVDVTIKQKGMFKKALSMQDFLGNTFKYGVLRANIIDFDKRDEEGFILYNPNAIARGIYVTYAEGNKSTVSLSLSLFTSDREVDEFYDLIIHLCDIWKTNVFEQDGTQYRISDIKEQRINIKNTCLSSLEEFLTKYQGYMIFGAYNPISIDQEVADMLLEKKDLKVLGEYLHTLQKQDVYYARPSFYQGEKGIFGIYTLTEDCDSVFPIEPMIPFGMKDPQTGGKLEVNHWYLGVYSISEEKILGQIDYFKFVEYVKLEEQSKYDARTNILKGLDIKHLKDMLENCEQIVL